MRDRQVVDAGDENAAHGTERLRVAEHTFPLLGIREQLGQPCDGGDEFHAHANEGRGPQEQQPVDVRRVTGRECRERVQQNAPRQNPPSSEPVGEIAAQQAEDAPEDGRDEKQNPDPVRIFGRARADVDQVGERRTDDQRQHQQFVGVERKPDRGDDADQPLGRRHGGGARSFVHAEVTRKWVIEFTSVHGGSDGGSGRRFRTTVQARVRGSYDGSHGG